MVLGGSVVAPGGLERFLQVSPILLGRSLTSYPEAHISVDDDSVFFGRPANPDAFPMVIQCESCWKDIEVSIGEVIQHAVEHYG